MGITVIPTTWGYCEEEDPSEIMHAQVMECQELISGGCGCSGQGGGPSGEPWPGRQTCTDPEPWFPFQSQFLNKHL